MTNDIKNAIQLISQLTNPSLLTEARHDNIINIGMGFIDKLVDKYQVEDLIAVKDAQHERIKKATSIGSFSTLPPLWKMWVCELMVFILFSKAYRAVDSDSPAKGALANKLAKIKTRHSGFDEDYDVGSLIDRLTILHRLDFDQINNTNPYVEHNFMRKLSELEREITNARMRGKTIEDTIEYDSNIEVFLDLGEYKWYWLDKQQCDLEGGAMNHCGNSASSNPNDKILSLRSIVTSNGKKRFRPSLTFIYNKGFLSEMRGRGNTKPSKKFTPHIFELLKDERIKGISKVYYEEQNNFEITDLSDAQREELVKLKGEEFLEFRSADDDLIVKYAEGDFDKDDYFSLVNELDSRELPSAPLHFNNYKLFIDMSRVIPERLVNELANGPRLSERLIDYSSYLYHMDLVDDVVDYIYNNYQEELAPKYAASNLEFTKSNIDQYLTNTIRLLPNDDIKDAFEEAIAPAHEECAIEQLKQAFSASIYEYATNHGCYTVNSYNDLVDEDMLLQVYSLDKLLDQTIRLPADERDSCFAFPFYDQSGLGTDYGRYEDNEVIDYVELDVLSDAIKNIIK